MIDLIDSGAARPKKKREKIRDYQPPELTRIPPLFVWPWSPVAFLKWVFAFPGYLWPWNTLYLAIALVSFFYLTPDLARMATFEIDWVGLIFLRNVGLIIAVVGAWHLRLYVKRAQGTEYKYNAAGSRQDNDNFLFRDQTARQHVLDVRQRRADLDGLRGGDALGVRQRLHPMARFGAHPVYCVALLLADPAAPRGPFLLRPPADPLAAALPHRPQAASQRTSIPGHGRASRCTRSSTCSTSRAC